MESRIFSCEPCNFHSKFKSRLDKHLKSTLHLTGVKKIRSDKKRLDKCPDCDYCYDSLLSMKSHILNNHASKEVRKLKFTYYCELCNVGVFSKVMFEKHLATKSHARVHGIIPAPSSTDDLKITNE
jgi:hypothetical protein